MNYNSGNARRSFYAKWDKLREEYRAAGMKEDAIQKMYEYDLAVFNDDRAHHRYDVEIPSADDSENRNDYADFVRATTVTDTYHETKTRFAWVGEVQNERLQAGLENYITASSARNGWFVRLAASILWRFTVLAGITLQSCPDGRNTFFPSTWLTTAKAARTLCR